MAVKQPEYTELKKMNAVEQDAAWNAFLNGLQRRTENELKAELEQKLAFYQRKCGMTIFELQESLCAGKVEPTKDMLKYSLTSKMYHALTRSSQSHGC